MEPIKLETMPEPDLLGSSGVSDGGDRQAQALLGCRDAPNLDNDPPGRPSLQLLDVKLERIQ